MAWALRPIGRQASGRKGCKAAGGNYEDDGSSTRGGSGRSRTQRGQSNIGCSRSPTHNKDDRQTRRENKPPLPVCATESVKEVKKRKQ